MIDLRKHTAPAAAEVPRRQALNDLSMSINDVVPVANATERAQLVTDLTAAGYGPTAARPLFVYQADQPVWTATKVTRDGTNWKSVLAGRLSAHTARTVAGAIPNNSITGLVWDAVTLVPTGVAADTGGIAIAGGETFTVPVAGRYLVSVRMSWAVNGTGYRSFWLDKNGGPTRVLQNDVAATGTSGVYLQDHADLILAANDTLAVRVLQNSGGTLNVNAGATFTIDYLGD